MPMKILALEPYHAGSHKAFLDTLADKSKHTWTTLTLPGYKWKWRMRHAAITFADQANQLIAANEKPDLLFCSDMLNLAEFTGLANPEIRDIPKIAYFHENQLTYPARFESERDYQFVMTNMTTALAADAVWFNSTFHRDSFLSALKAFLKRMPDYQPLEAVEHIRTKSAIHPQGIDIPQPERNRTPGPAHILWPCRWEHDKNPEDFFTAIGKLKDAGTNFTLSVIGESFRDSPKIFAKAKKLFAGHIINFGYLTNRQDYLATLSQADIVVSTAKHEFFGISIAEAIASGSYPLLPKRLAYPELLQLDENPKMSQFFYPGPPKSLTDKLIKLCQNPDELYTLADPARKAIERFNWQNLIKKMDTEIEKITHSKL